MHTQLYPHVFAQRVGMYARAMAHPDVGSVAYHLPTPTEVQDAIQQVHSLLSHKQAFVESGFQLRRGQTYNPIEDVTHDLRTIFQGEGLDAGTAARTIRETGLLYYTFIVPILDDLHWLFMHQPIGMFYQLEEVMSMYSGMVRAADIGNAHEDDGIVAVNALIANIRRCRGLERHKAMRMPRTKTPAKIDEELLPTE